MDTVNMETVPSNRPGKVVHVIGALAAGGAERFVSELVREFKKSGIDVALLILSKRVDAVGNQMRVDLERAGVRLHAGPTIRVGARTVLWYMRTLYQERPDIVHLHTPNTELAHYLATRLYRLPHRIYRTIHSVRPSNSLTQRLARQAINVSISIACGTAVQKAHSQDLSGEIITIENGVRFNWPIRTDDNASEAKRMHGFDNQRFHFLIIGSMNGRNLRSSPKAHDVLINAWRRSKLGERACVLHILGDGALRVTLTTLADGDNSIIFHGVQPNVHEWLLAADCYVMPSRYEGLPIAGIEAAGTGLPCIFSDIAPLQELQVPQALSVPSNDVGALTRALLQAATERPHVNASEVHQFRNRFDIKQTAKTYAALYMGQLESKVA